MSDGKKIIPESDVTIGEALQRKQYGTVKDAQCLVCERLYSLGKILLQDPVAPSAVTLGLCPSHQSDVDKGNVILVAVDQGSPKYPSGQIDPHKVRRLGAEVSMAKTTYHKIFLQHAPSHGVVFVSMEVVDTIKNIADQLDAVTK